MRKFLVMSGAILLAAVIVLAFLLWTGGKQFEHERRARSAAVFKLSEEIGKEISDRVTPIAKRSGLCASPCPQAESAAALHRWSMHSATGSLLVLLFPNLHGKGDYSLYIYAVTPQADGIVRDERLSRTLGDLLRAFDFPNADDPYRELSQPSGAETRKAVGPQKFNVLWPPFPHKQDMAAQWQWSLIKE